MQLFKKFVIYRNIVLLIYLGASSYKRFFTICINRIKEEVSIIMEENKTTRQIQSENTKQKLMTASFNVILKNGFDNAKIEDICKEADVSIGTFYHHLKNKAGIVIEEYTKCDNFFSDVVIKELKNENTCDAIVKYINYQMQYAVEFGIDLTTQIYKAQLTEGTDFFLSKERGITKGLYEIIERVQENGYLKKEKLASEIGSELLIISRGILYNWCQNKGNYDIKKIAKEMISNYLEAYKINIV